MMNFRFMIANVMFCICAAQHAALAQNATAIVVSAFEAEAKSSTKQIDSNVSLSNGKFSQRLEVVLPYRFHVIWKGDGITKEYYVIGRTLYLLKAGAWNVVTLPAASGFDSMAGSFSDVVRSGIRNAVATGTEQVNGKAATRYEFELSFPAGASSVQGTGSVWIDDASRLPVRIDFKGTRGGLEQASSQSITYDRSVQVNSPLP